MRFRLIDAAKKEFPVLPLSLSISLLFCQHIGKMGSAGDRGQASLSN
jgi:hypothetical protein